MDSKCLITKLKAVVDNPNLPCLGELVLVTRFDSSENPAKAGFMVDSFTDFKAEILNPSSATYFTNDSQENLGTKISSNQLNVAGDGHTKIVRLVAPKGTKIRLYSMYDIKTLGLGDASGFGNGQSAWCFIENPEFLINCKSLSALNIYNVDEQPTIHFSDLSGSTFSHLMIHFGRLVAEGNINDLKLLPGANICLASPGVVGDFGAILDGWIGKVDTSQTYIYYSFNETNMTLHGKKINISQLIVNFTDSGWTSNNPE